MGRDSDERRQQRASAGKSGRQNAARAGPVVLGDGVRDGWLLRAYCEACGHHAPLRPAVLARMLGYDFPVAALGGRLRCSRCSAREVSVRVQMPDPGVVTRHGPADRPARGPAGMRDSDS